MKSKYQCEIEPQTLKSTSPNLGGGPHAKPMTESTKRKISKALKK